MRTLVKVANAGRLAIRGIAGMDIEGMTGQNGGEVTVAGMPFCVVPGVPSVVAKSERVSYRDYDLAWEIGGRNGFYSAFAYQG